MAYYIAENDTHFAVRTEQKLFSPATGEPMGKKRRVYARFQRGCPDWAVPIAQRHFGLRAKPEEYSAQRWVGFYDSGFDQQLCGWTDEERKAIEKRLDDAVGVIRVEQEKAPAPFDNYVKLTTVQGKRTIDHVVAKVQEFLDELGVAPQVIVAFERDNPRKESDAILAALETEEEEAEPLVAA